MADTYRGTLQMVGEWDPNTDYNFIFNQLVTAVQDPNVGNSAYYTIEQPTLGLPPSQDPFAWKTLDEDYVKTQTLTPSTTFDYTLTNVNVISNVTVDVAQMVLNRIYNIKSFADNTVIALSNGSWDSALEGNSYSLLYAGFTVSIQKINTNTVRII